MSVRDWLILKDIETAVEGVAGIKTVMTTACDSSVDVPASGFPAGLVLWKETRERLSGAKPGEMAGRVQFVIAVVVRETDGGKALENALALGEAVREAVMADPGRSGLASANGNGAATELGTAEVFGDRKPPVVEVRLTGSCGYYAARG